VTPDAAPPTPSAAPADAAASRADVAVPGAGAAPAADAEDAAPADAFDPMRSRARFDLLVAFGCGLVVLLAALFEVTPARDGVTAFGGQLPEICFVKRMGGTCPGCGLTRSFVLGVRGDPAAFRLHPFGPILLALVALQVPLRTWRAVQTWGQVRRGEVDLAFLERRADRWLLPFLVGGMVVSFVVRLWLDGPAA